MAKRKTNKPKVQSYMAEERTIPLRRSIPVNEVEQIVDRAVSNVKASLTIYDDRLETLNQLKDNESYLEHLEHLLHETRLKNKRIRSDLAQINLAIKRQLELDVE